MLSQALFLGRAVVDEVLPPAFLVAVLPALPDGCLGVSVVHAAGLFLTQPHCPPSTCLPFLRVWLDKGQGSSACVPSCRCQAAHCRLSSLDLKQYLHVACALSCSYKGCVFAQLRC